MDLIVYYYIVYIPICLIDLVDDFQYESPIFDHIVGVCSLICHNNNNNTSNTEMISTCNNVKQVRASHVYTHNSLEL